MKKTLKYCLTSIAIITSIIFINGCYYVFYGQERSMKRLQQGKELNLYECCSIYSMHMATWMFGWPISIDAAKYAYWLQFDCCETRRDFTSIFYNSEVISSNPHWKTKTPFKVSWPTDLSKLSRKELYYALAYNSNNTWVYFTEDGYPLLEYRVEYQNVKYKFGIMTIHTGLFKYLQKIGWLHPELGRLKKTLQECRTKEDFTFYRFLNGWKEKRIPEMFAQIPFCEKIAEATGLPEEEVMKM